MSSDRAADTHDRVRTDRVDNTGLVTLRHLETVAGAHRAVAGGSSRGKVVVRVGR